MMSDEEKEAINNEIQSNLYKYVNIALNFYYNDREKYILQTIIKELHKESQKIRDAKDKEINKLMNIKLYACDTEKNKECNKIYCIENGGECDATTDETMAKYINLDDYVSKDKIKILYNHWCSRMHILLPNSSGEEKRQEYIAEGAAEALETLL